MKLARSVRAAARAAIAFVTLLSSAAMLAPPLAAQGMPGARDPRVNTSGFFLGLGLGISSLESDDLTDGTESGGGLALALGYGFTPRFTLLLEAAAASLDAEEGEEVALGHFDIGARYHFLMQRRRVVPFVEVAFTGRALLQEDAIVVTDEGDSFEGDLEISGGGFTVGGGVLYYLNPRWALTGTLKFTGGEFSEVKVGRVSVSGFELDASTTRLFLGANWYPRGRSR